MTPTEAAAWLRHGGEHVAGMLDTLDRGMRPPLFPEDVEAIRTLVELAERLDPPDQPAFRCTVQGCCRVDADPIGDPGDPEWEGFAVCPVHDTGWGRVAAQWQPWQEATGGKA